MLPDADQERLKKITKVKPTNRKGSAPVTRCHGNMGRGRLVRTYDSMEGDMSWLYYVGVKVV
jgi:hypothetical protein